MILPDTSVRSLIHKLAGYRGSKSAAPAKMRIYLITAALVHIPLAIAALVGPKPPESHLQFFHDWAAAFVLLVSCPTLATLMATDDYVLSDSLARVQRNGIVQISALDDKFSMIGPQVTFGTFNLVSQFVGLGIGLFVAWETIRVYALPEIGFWTTDNQGLLPIAYVYQYSLTLVYAVITVFVLRTIALSFYLWRLMAQATVKMVPFHPDRCGGLQPVGWLGLRNQYTLSVLGLNVVLLLMTSRRLNLDWSVDVLLMDAVLAYLVLGPIVFIGPLLPFRRGMIRAKGEWIDEIQQSFQVEFERLRIKLRSPQITKEDQESIERLQKISAFVGELPVWPFDASTLRKFLTAYIVPVVVSLGGQVVPLVLTWIRRSLV